MASNMELTPETPQPLLSQTQQLLSPCESPKRTEGCLENFGLSDNQADNLELRNHFNPTSQGHDTSDPIFHLIPPVKRALSLKSSLFVEGNENVMEDNQVVEDNIDKTMSRVMENSHVIDNNYIVENGYAMEGDNTMKEEHQMVYAPEAEIDDDEDTLPSVDKIFDQEMAHLQLQKSREIENDDIDFAEEDEGSECEDDSSVSSDSDSEYEAPQSNRTLAAEKNGEKPRRKLAQSAREYVARLHEKEDQKNARKIKQGEGKKPSAKRPLKRKLTTSDMGPSKAIKTANGNSYFLANGTSSSSNNGPLLPAESIKARTHADQMAQLKASIPKNCDTRRKNTQKQDLEEAVKVFGYKRLKPITAIGD